MPTKSIKVMDGPVGHQHCHKTFWDYDRAPSLYLLVCECGTHIMKSWDWKEVEEAYQKHLKKLSAAGLAEHMSDIELSNRLKDLLSNNFLGDTQKVLIEAAIKRLRHECK